jgi:hypothetical protein
MAMSAYPLLSDQFEGQVKLCTSADRAWVVGKSPGGPVILLELDQTTVVRQHGKWILEGPESLHIEFTDAGGCGCGDPLKRFDPRPLPVIE